MNSDSRNPRVSLLKKYDIPIDHLSFEYIESCKDKKELERIVRILRSGEEGIFPDLIKTAENQLRQISPNSRVLRVETPALRKELLTDEEWKSLQDELQTFENEINVMDKGLEFEKNRYNIVGNKNMPEVRKTVERLAEKKGKNDNNVKKIKVETNTKNERIKSGDYAAWEKFDVDKELLKLDLDDERINEKNAKMKREMEKQKKKIEEKKIEPINVDKDSYSDMEKQILANQAKDRGNECFKSGDHANALKYYNISLSLCSTANVYNNRAMTYIKLKNYEEALNDCNKVLELEPNNVKALHRRATAYQNLPTENLNEALKDLLKIVSLEPSNRVAQSDLQSLKKKLNIEDVGKKFSMMIDEGENNETKDSINKSNSSEDKSQCNNNDNLTAIHKLPLTYYGPSTSTFQCEPQSMTHRILSGPWLSGQVMCKCNSNVTRQNPLCHHCGEKMSRPRKKPKPVVQNPETKSETISPNVEKPKEKKEISPEDNQVRTGIEEETSDKRECGKEIVEDEFKEKSEKVEENIKRDETELKNVINELNNNDRNIDKVDIRDEKPEADDGKVESIDINRKLFEELDMSIKERKNLNNEKFKDSLAVKTENITEIVNSDQNESLPKACSQTETKQESKKSRRRKKKKGVRESREEDIGLRYREPVKIVQATKYLKPTSAEPKPEVVREVQKEESNEGKCQFKSFVPRKNSGGDRSDNGILNVVPHCRNSMESVIRPCYQAPTVKTVESSEGNKENIMDGKSFENNRNNRIDDVNRSPSSSVSSFEFIRSWEAMKKSDESYEKRAEIIRVMQPENLKNVIGSNLDSEMLTSLLECLEKHFVEKDPKKVVGMLQELPQIPRFSLVNLFLSPNERKVIERLIDLTEKKGFVLEEEVKSCLKLSL